MMIHRITHATWIGAAAATLLCGAAMAQRPPGTSPASKPNAVAGGTESGISNVFSDEGPGANFIGNGRTTRGSVVSCPVNVPLGGLPAGAMPTATIVVWNYLTDDAPGSDTIMVNGTPVTGSLVGTGSPDLCWEKETAAVYAYGELGLLPFINPGGNNIVNNACDKALGGDPAALGEGVSIIVTYRLPVGAEARVNLYWGYVSTESGATVNLAEATLSLGDVYKGGMFRMLVNGLDGQSAPDRFFVNGFDVSSANGLGGPDNAWAGFLGPNTDSNYYDHALDNFAGAMTIGDTTVTFTTEKVNDCIGHSVVALRFVTDDCPWDLNDDGVVNPADLAILLANWNAPFGPPELAALLAAWGDCPFSCPGEGSCSEPNGSPGCENEMCCEEVCAIDPFCCDTTWDQICADEAINLCFGCNADAGPCGQPNGTPGCDDVECCLAVCAIDTFCCDVEWDQVCANEAADLCFPLPACCEADDLAEGEPCGTDTNGGCNSTPNQYVDAACGQTYCGTAWAEGGTRDTDWYRVTVTAPTILSGTLFSSFNGVVFIFTDTCPVTTLGSGDSVDCVPGTATATVMPGSYIVFVATSTFDGVPCGGDTNGYRLKIACEAAPVCGPGAGSCFESNGSPGCEDASCCEQVCAIDPFCCDNTWDSLCADEAGELCLGCAPDSGACDMPNGTPGCENVDCCILVCLADPFCCDNTWDQICADEAIEMCNLP